MDNLFIYEKARVCPGNALRPIQAGKLKGKSDINPVWRIKMLTELFGPCGVGWKLCNVKYWTEPGAGGEVAAWCSMELKIKVDGQWSDGIEGVGGSMLINTEKGKLVTNDEAFKMAYTDAVSVCCKMLGVAADVYWEADRTKYSAGETGGNTPPPQAPAPRPSAPPPPPARPCQRCGQAIKVTRAGGKVYSVKEIAENAKNTFGHELCWNCMKALQAEKQAADGQ